MNGKKDLKPRVYRRNRQWLVILWEDLSGTKDNFDPVAAKLQLTVDDTRHGSPSFGERRELDVKNVRVSSHAADIPKGMLTDFTPNGSTIICVIGHDINGIDPEGSYYLRVSCWGVNSGVRIMPAGVYPPTEKEDREKNSHLMAWDPERNEWRKLECKVINGRTYLLIATPESLENFER